MTGSHEDGMLYPDPLALGTTIVEADGRAAHAINLVPSENRISPLAALPLKSDFYNRYFFNADADEMFWEFRGAEEVGHIERLGIEALRRMAGARYCNVRPISGMSAMVLVIAGLSRPGSTVISIDQDSGGHYATPSLLRRMGRQSRVVGYKGNEVDYQELYDALRRGDVDLVYIDVQNCLRVPAVAPVAALIKEVSPSTLFYVDASHYLGLVLGGYTGNPLSSGADAFGGSTHKSFPGPQKGVIFTKDVSIGNKLTAAQFDLISSHHSAETLALALAAIEVEQRIADYSRATVLNAQRLAGALAAAGFKVHGDEGSGYTETHQIWVEVGSKHDAYSMSNRLAAAGIRVNLQSNMPGLPGVHLRLGSNEVTFEGAGEMAIDDLGDALCVARDRLLDVDTARRIRSRFGEPFYHSAEMLRVKAGLC